LINNLTFLIYSLILRIIIRHLMKKEAIMKIKIYLMTVFSFCLLFTGCVSVGEQPFNTGTRTDLSKAN